MGKFIQARQRGFTLPELIIVMSIFAIITGYATVNLLSSRSSATVSSALLTIETDLKSQQAKAMVGYTGGGTTNDSFGIYFSQMSYTLFHGTSYSAGDPGNFVVNLEDNIQISSILLPDDSVIFSKGSGEIFNFSALNNRFTIDDATSTKQATIELNRLGSITSVN